LDSNTDPIDNDPHISDHFEHNEHLALMFFMHCSGMTRFPAVGIVRDKERQGIPCLPTDYEVANKELREAVLLNSEKQTILDAVGAQRELSLPMLSCAACGIREYQSDARNNYHYVDLNDLLLLKCTIEQSAKQHQAGVFERVYSYYDSVVNGMRYHLHPKFVDVMETGDIEKAWLCHTCMLYRTVPETFAQIKYCKRLRFRIYASCQLTTFNCSRRIGYFACPAVHDYHYNFGQRHYADLARTVYYFSTRGTRSVQEVFLLWGHYDFLTHSFIYLIHWT
jgi:hypothetical protein